MIDRVVTFVVKQMSYCCITFVENIGFSEGGKFAKSRQTDPESAKILIKEKSVTFVIYAIRYAGQGVPVEWEKEWHTDDKLGRNQGWQKTSSRSKKTTSL